MAYTEEQPTVSGSPDRDGRETHKHPAYGVISITRPQNGGKGIRLFDSAVGHNDYVSIKISNAENHRQLNRDWVSERETICEFMVSEAQWAQIVASSMGRGTPITFRYKPDNGYKLMVVPGIAPIETMKQTFDREMKAKCKEYVQEIVDLKAKVDAMLANGKANKTQLTDLSHQLGVFAQNLPSNMSFTQKQFAEAMEKTTEAAKSDIESFVVNLAMRTGLDVLRERQVQLTATEPAEQPLIEE